MKSNLRIANLLVIIGIFGFSSVVLAQKTAPNKAQAKASGKSATPKKAKNINTGEVKSANSGSNRPSSTGSGNGNNRPASTGETLSERDRVERATRILLFARTFPNGVVEDSGSNLARARGFIDGAKDSSWILRNRFNNANSYDDNYETNYTAPYPSDMNGVKINLQQALDYLNGINFETEQNHRAKAIDFTTRAIRQIEAYLIDPPSPKRKTPTKNARNGAEVKQTSNASGTEKMVNSNGIDTSLKTNPAGSTGKSKKSKNTNESSKSSSKMTKPTENLFPLDDPWGKTPKKSKKKN